MHLAAAILCLFAGFACYIAGAFPSRLISSRPFLQAYADFMLLVTGIGYHFAAALWAAAGLVALFAAPVGRLIGAA